MKTLISLTSLALLIAGCTKLQPYTCACGPCHYMDGPGFEFIMHGSYIQAKQECDAKVNPFESVCPGQTPACILY